MSVETIDTLVIGAGQAGIAMSEHLSAAAIPHLVIERDRIAGRWRNARWDSLVANGPAWHDRFPGLEFEGDPGAFVAKDKVADYFESYVQKFSLPVRCGIAVERLEPEQGGPGYRVATSAGEILAGRVVVATGAFQLPVIPPVLAPREGLNQIHSAQYFNPGQLPQGAVLVVGAGSSGVQIADELNRAGRRVYLSVGAHERPPRAYRGRDFCWWLGVLGKWDMPAPAPGTGHVTIAVSGARGGETIDFRRLALEGITLLGMTGAEAGGRLSFEDDLVQNLNRGDASLFALLDEADAYVSRQGLDLPLDPQARQRFPDAACVREPIRALDLAAEGITSVIWATGYRADYSWIAADAFDAAGRPLHSRGVSAQPGLYFLGLPWQSRRGSSFIWGVWHDAKYIADQIAIQRSYMAHHHAQSGEAPRLMPDRRG